MSKPTKTKEHDAMRHPAKTIARPFRKPPAGNSGNAAQKQRLYARRDNPNRDKS
jgi:hypothetical protein